MIETHGLVKLYGTHAALRGVSLEVPAGQVLTILGHNGSGKTTLVRLLATLTRPTAGRGRIGGWLPAPGAPSLGRGGARGGAVGE